MRRPSERIRWNRRRVLLAAGTLLAAPRLFAQRTATARRIGFLAVPNAFEKTSPNHYAWNALESALRDLGYREGDSLQIERRHASGDIARLPEVASQLIKSAPEVVVVFGAQSTMAAYKASKTVPIVSYSGDLVKLGLASSYAHPGENVTGVSPSTLDVTLKKVELLRELIPKMQRIAWLLNPSNQYLAKQVAEGLERGAPALGVTAIRFDAGSVEALEAAIRKISLQRFDAVLIPADVFFVEHRARLSELLLRYRLASVSLDRVMLDAGILMTYGVDLLDGIRRMAGQVDKILRGAPAGTIPIDFIERFSLGINAKTARALGITIPRSILVRSDRVIE